MEMFWNLKNIFSCLSVYVFFFFNKGIFFHKKKKKRFEKKSNWLLYNETIQKLEKVEIINQYFG